MYNKHVLYCKLVQLMNMFQMRLQMFLPFKAFLTEMAEELSLNATLVLQVVGEVIFPLVALPAAAHPALHVGTVCN